MKRIAMLIAAFGLAAVSARADEVKVEEKQDKNHVVIEKKHKSNGHTRKAKGESKSRRRMGGGTVSTTETTVEHQRHVAVGAHPHVSA